MVIFGFDPGGEGRNAVALLRKSNDASQLEIETAQVTSARAALDWIRSKSQSGKLSGVGIDAPLHWSLSEAGWRPADRALRKKYPELRNSVLSANAAYGAMVVQGMALAIEVRREWPKSLLNEVHPKVVFRAFSGCDYIRGSGERQRKKRVQFWKSKRVIVNGNMSSEDEFDATICCWATYKGRIGKWQTDLAKTLSAQGLIFPVDGVKYYWPCEL